MKDKIKYIIFGIVVIGIIISLIYSKSKNDKVNVNRDVNISYTDPTEIESYDNNDETELNETELNETELNETDSSTELTETSKESTETSTDVSVSSLVHLTDDNFKDTIIKLATLDSSTVSNLDNLPITESFKNNLKEKQSTINGVDSSTAINFKMGGISENNTYMAQFRVGNIVYIITGNIVNNQIDSFDYKQM